MMKHLKFLATILLAVSCNVKEAPEAAVPHGADDRLYAEIEGVQPIDSKVYVDGQLRVLWHADDRISVFNKYTYNQEYQFAGQTGDNAGAFNKVASDDLVTGNALPSLWAVYPYQASNKISNDGELSVEYPSVQSYAPGTFGRGAGVMVSATDDNRLLFKNACGVLVFRLYGSGVSVNSITLRGNGGEKIAGPATVTMAVGGVPAAVMDSGASDEITLTCADPVALGASESDCTSFWFALPPTDFSAGFTITVAGPGGVFEKSTSKPVSITRNHLSRMAPLEVALVPDAPVASVSDAIVAKDNAAVDFQALVCATGSRAAVVTDGSAYVSVYAGTSGVPCLAGDMVRVQGTKITYRGNPEISNPQITVLSSGNALPDFGYQDITDSFDSFSSVCCVPVTFQGVLQVMSPGIENTVVKITGASYKAYLYWPLAGLFDPAALNGKEVVVKGFYLFNTGANQRDIIPVSVELAATAGMADNVIRYTSTDGQIVTPNKSDVFGAAIVSNVYEDGKGTITFDGPVSTIGYEAFEGCTTLQTVTLPQSVESVNFYAFKCCSGLKSFFGKFASDDGRSLIRYGMLVGFAPAGLSMFTVPEGATKVLPGVFADCAELKILVFPEYVSSIGQVISCPNLQSIVFKSATPPTLDKNFWTGDSFELFPDTNNCKIYVPLSSLNTYWHADDWSVYVDRIWFISDDIVNTQSAPDNSPVSLIGWVVAAGTRGFVITDGDAYILVYTLSVSCSVGDKVKVEGFKTTYQGVPEISADGLAYSVLSSGNQIPAMSFTDITDVMDSFSSTSAVPVKLRGVYSDGNVLVDGASRQAYLYWSPASFGLSGFKDKTVLIKGIYLFDYGGRRAIMLTSVKEVTVPEAVNLGLSVKWASFNIGASAPEGYGDYYAWAETATKSNYDWSTYLWCNGDYDKLTKYCSQSSYGKVDSKTTIDPDDDVASDNLGGSWRMPTNSDWNDLKDNCDWRWTTENGVNGYRVTSKISGYTDKSIFLPAAGEKAETSLNLAGSEGVYWSSNTVSGMSFYAYYLSFTSSAVETNGTARYFGFPIRPVCP